MFVRVELNCFRIKQIIINISRAPLNMTDFFK